MDREMEDGHSVFKPVRSCHGGGPAWLRQSFGCCVVNVSVLARFGVDHKQQLCEIDGG